MIVFLDRVAGGLDGLRSRAIRLGTRSHGAREIFRARETRHAYAFGVALAAQLALAVKWPIPMAVIGPALFGGAHLIASLRHGFSARPERVFEADRLRVFKTAAVWALVALARLFGVGLLDVPFGIEILALAILASVWWPFLARKGLSLVGFFSVLALLAAATVRFPFGTIASVAILHHFVAALHWLRATESSAERRSAAVGIVVFAGIHGLIFAGAFDRFMGSSEWGGVPYSNLESLFYGWSVEPIWLARSLVAYVFGQSVHYFLWLKLIPEQQHRARVPTGFRQSLRMLRRDLGDRGNRFALAFVASLGLAVAFVPSADFRSFYLSLAAMHGFSEILGLFTNRRAV